MAHIGRAAAGLSSIVSENRAIQTRSGVVKDSVLEDVNSGAPGQTVVFSPASGPANYNVQSEADKRHLQAKVNLSDGSMGLPVTTESDLRIEKQRIQNEQQFKGDAFIQSRQGKALGTHPLLLEKQLATLNASFRGQALLAESLLRGGKRGYPETQEQADVLYAYKESEKAFKAARDSGQSFDVAMDKLSVHPFGVHLQASKTPWGHFIGKDELRDTEALGARFDFVYPRPTMKALDRTLFGAGPTGQIPRMRTVRRTMGAVTQEE